MKYDFENKFPLWHTHKGRVPKTNQIVIGEEVINVWPDNDGGCWYYKDGKAVKVDEG